MGPERLSADRIVTVFPRSGINAASGVSIGVFAQFSNGNYLAYDGNPASGVGGGNGTTSLSILTGDPASSLSATEITSCRTTLAEGHKNTAGSVVGSSANSITNAWIAPNGDLYFVEVSTGNLYHLFRAKASTYTVGSDASYSNKQACIDLGLHDAVHSANIRVLGQKSFLAATVNGETHLYLAEYNVASGRTGGSGGAGKDQAMVYRSTDNGDTWTVFFEFNTGGSHQIDHFHSVVQDPYSGWIYFMTGDSGNECAIIAYNGTASAVAANATLSTISATAGYKVIYGNELARYTDLFFDPLEILGIPDCDTEAAESTTTAFVNVSLPKTLDYVASISAVERHSNIPPLYAIRNSTYGGFYVSFRTESANTSGEPYIWIWGLNLESRAWVLIAKIKNHRAATGVPVSAFFDDDGRLWIGASYKGGITFNGGITASGSSTSVVLTMGRRVSEEFVFDG